MLGETVFTSIIFLFTRLNFSRTTVPGTYLRKFKNELDAPSLNFIRQVLSKTKVQCNQPLIISVQPFYSAQFSLSNNFRSKRYVGVKLNPQAFDEQILQLL